MLTFFSSIPNEPKFNIMSLSHIIPLVILIALIILLVNNRESIRKYKNEKYIRYGLAATLIISDLSIYIWRFSTDTFTIKSSLPFHLCTITAYLLAYILVTKNEKLFKYVFYAGLAGAIMALGYPDFGRFNFTQYRYYEYFIIHLALVVGLLYMVLVHRFIPRKDSLVKSIIAVHIYAIVFIIPFNYLTGGTYMMLVNTPQGVQNLVGAWPGNIFILEFLMLLLLGIAYLSTYLLVLRKEQ